MRLSVLALSALVVMAGCKKSGFGEPGSLLVVKHAGMARGPDGSGTTIVEKIPDDDPLAASVKSILAQQFAGDAWKVHQQVRAYVGAQKDAGTKKLLEQPVVIVLGAPALALPATGLVWQHGEGETTPLPDVLYASIPLAESNADTGALEQALAGAIGQLSMRVMLSRAWARVPAWQHGSLPAHPWVLTDPMSALVQGYGLHLETLARRFSRSGKLTESLSVDASDAPTARIAAVTTNRYAHQPPPPTDTLRTPDERLAFVRSWMKQAPPLKGTLWRGAQMVGIPGVVANVLNTITDDPVVSLAETPNTLLAPFLGGKVPADFNVKSLHQSQPAELRLLHAVWARLGDKDAPAHPGVNSLVEAFGAEFPELREAGIKALISGTYARTASTAAQNGVEGTGMIARTIADVLSGALYPDGAVGGAVMARIGELTFNLNAAMPWQLEAVPGLLKEDVERLLGRLEKRPITKLDELAGSISAEAYSALEAGSK